MERPKAVASKARPVRVTPKTEKSPAGTECTKKFAQKNNHYGWLLRHHP